MKGSGFSPYSNTIQRLRVLNELVRDPEVEGSNPFAPAISFHVSGRSEKLLVRDASCNPFLIQIWRAPGILPTTYSKKTEESKRVLKNSSALRDCLSSAPRYRSDIVSFSQRSPTGDWRIRRLPPGAPDRNQSVVWRGDR